MFFQLEAILESPLTFPALECFHIAGFGLGVGTIAVVDFRMLGWALPKAKVSDIAASLSRWTTIGLTLVFLSAGGLFYSDPDLYYLNPSFQIKMTILMFALIFHFTVHQKRAFEDQPAKWVGAVSLLLWASVTLCGIFIAFTGEAG
ncbi:MAG: hypothetical protein ABIR70_01065 [Bryobacteraceae bacterium]